MVSWQLHPSVLSPENIEVEGAWSQRGQGPPGNDNYPMKTEKGYISINI